MSKLFRHEFVLRRETGPWAAPMIGIVDDDGVIRVRDLIHVLEHIIGPSAAAALRSMGHKQEALVAITMEMGDE